MKKLGLLIMPLMAVSLLASCNNGGDTPIPNPKTIERTINFNIPDCKMYYGDTEIKSSGTKIEIPDVDPYYVKFSVKADDSIYMKPSDVILDKTTEYSFNKDNGDLFINLQSDLNVTGTCDMYKTLEECSWAQIKVISEAKEAPNAFHIGDEKIIKMNNKEHRVRIIGFNHDYSELPDNGSNPDPSKVLGITFEFANVITKSNGDAVTTIWDGEYQKSGDNFDYRNSVLNTFLNDETYDSSVINMLPNDLKEVIKPVDKKVGVSTDSGNTYTATSFDGSNDYPYPYLFPLAHNEITDNARWVTEGEGSKYQYYVEHPDQEDRIKRKAGIEIGDGKTYWLRSPYANGSAGAWYADYVGTLHNGVVYNLAYSAAPAFCI